jgi:hypothetical protein
MVRCEADPEDDADPENVNGRSRLDAGRCVCI